MDRREAEGSDSDKHEGGYHKEWDNSDYVTANNTNDPRHQDRDPDSYYVAYGNADDGHVTQVFDGDGNQIGGD